MGRLAGKDERREGREPHRLGGGSGIDVRASAAWPLHRSASNAIGPGSFHSWSWALTPIDKALGPVAKSAGRRRDMAISRSRVLNIGACFSPGKALL